MIRGSIGILEADIEHHPCEELGSFIARHNRYTSLQAQEWLNQGQSPPSTRLISSMVRRPWKTFWKSYVKKQGFREGLHGFLFAYLFAYIEFVKWVKCWELSQTGSRPAE